jgi:hypothetical protein
MTCVVACWFAFVVWLAVGLLVGIVFGAIARVGRGD